MDKTQGQRSRAHALKLRHNAETGLNKDANGDQVIHSGIGDTPNSNQIVLVNIQ